jgi:hypothetical protein
LRVVAHDAALALLHEEKVEGLLDEILNGRLVLGGEKLDLLCDLGLEIPADEALALAGGTEGPRPLLITRGAASGASSRTWRSSTA